MLSAPGEVAFELASMITLLRDKPEARSEQAAQFRKLVAAIGGRGLDLRANDAGLRVYGVPVLDSLPMAGALRTHLLDRGIGDLKLAGTATVAQLLDVVRMLARPPGSFESLQLMAASLPAAVRSILVLAPPADEGLVAAGDWNVHEDVTGRGIPIITSRIERQQAELPDHLVAIQAAPRDPSVADRLNEVVRAVDRLAGEEMWTDVLDTAAVLVEAEAQAQGSDVSRAYGIAFRRMMPRRVVEQLARLVTRPECKQAGQAVMRRVGADATEALLALLAASDRMEDRRAYFDTLRQMTEGTDLLVNMLTHDEWFVVRNVADLAGELRLTSAVSRLAKHARHPDERVRRSVAVALARIAAASGLEALRALLRDKSPSVRLALVQQVDARLRGLAMSISVALDEETHAEIVREMLHALGRIGTSETVKVLANAAAPGGRLLRRKPVANRIAAIEALGLSGSAQAETFLRGLVDDREPRVREAVALALGNPPQTMVG